MKKIQVTYELPQSSEREYSNLLDIKDNYEKLLIAYHNPEDSDHQGIKLINVIDWLMDEFMIGIFLTRKVNTKSENIKIDKIGFF
jgi:hypothetical protein